jgi:hypothetical protein
MILMAHQLGEEQLIQALLVAGGPCRSPWLRLRDPRALSPASASREKRQRPIRIAGLEFFPTREEALEAVGLRE